MRIHAHSPWLAVARSALKAQSPDPVTFMCARRYRKRAAEQRWPGELHGKPCRQHRDFDRNHPGRARGVYRRRGIWGASVGYIRRARRAERRRARRRVRRYRDKPRLHLSRVLQPRAWPASRRGTRARRSVDDFLGVDHRRHGQIRPLDHARRQPGRGRYSRVAGPSGTDKLRATCAAAAAFVRRSGTSSTRARSI